MIDEVEPLVRLGVAVHLLHERSKRPIGEDWEDRPVATFAQLDNRYRAGMNVGARTGKWSKIDGAYLHVIDMDVRDPEAGNEAQVRLEQLFKGHRIWRSPQVISGSGGMSRHIYILTNSAHRSRKLATSGKKFTDKDGKQRWTWEIELFGTGKQVVLPPSIHPDTGKPYEWLNEFDPDVMTPVADRIIDRLLYSDEPGEGDPTETAALNLTYREAEDILAELPTDYWCEDREGWRNVGMALHHEFDGADAAYDIWTTFSKQSRKFDPHIQRQQWRSFRSNTDRPIRMASLLAAVKDRRIMEAFDDEDEDVDDGPDTDEPFRKKSDPDLTILRQSRFEAPQFPLHLFGGFWSRNLAAWAENGSAPVDYTGAALLASAGSLIGNSTWVSPRPGWAEPPILWCQVVGLPSTNKTPAFRPLIRILDVLEQRWLPLHIDRHRRWQGEKKVADQKRKQWEAIMADKIAKGEDPGDLPADCAAPPEPHKRRAYMTDATIEALIRIHAGNERGFLNFRDEMTGWFANLARYSNGTDRPAWLEAYTGGSYVVDRVKDEGVEVRVPRFSVGILGGIQPERLIDMLQSTDDGLQARFIPFWPEHPDQPFSRGVELEDHALNALSALSELAMKKGKDGAREPYHVPFTEKALDAFEEWANRHKRAEKYAHPKLHGPFGKANGHVARLSLIFEYLWWCEFDDDDPPQEISAKAVRAAIEFRESYIVPMQRRVHGFGLETTEARIAKAIAGWIIENRVEDFNLRRVRREAGIEGISGRTEIDRVEEAISHLVSLRWISEAAPRERKAGRPATNFHVNERLWKMLDINDIV